jgi:hypothetical protein
MGVNGTEDVATSLEWPAAIAYDSLDGKVYWLDVLTRKIQRADSDGSNVEDLVFDVDAPFEPGNLVIDRCQGSADCNLNDRADLCDLFCRTSSDLNSNGVPDECDPDCQPNGITDDIDIAAAWSVDCNANQTPDECDLRDGVSPDCNGSDIPDECELRDGESQDCNGNNTLDECDIATCGGSPACGDCNQNRIPDECDLAAGLLQDSDGDGVPNTCNATIPAASAWGMLVLTLLLLVAGKLRFRALPLAQSQAFPFKLPRRG